MALLVPLTHKRRRVDGTMRRGTELCHATPVHNMNDFNSVLWFDDVRSAQTCALDVVRWASLERIRSLAMLDTLLVRNVRVGFEENPWRVPSEEFLAKDRMRTDCCARGSWLQACRTLTSLTVQQRQHLCNFCLALSHDDLPHFPLVRCVVQLVVLCVVLRRWRPGCAAMSILLEYLLDDSCDRVSELVWLWRANSLNWLLHGLDHTAW